MADKPGGVPRKVDDTGAAGAREHAERCGAGAPARHESSRVQSSVLR